MAAMWFLGGLRCYPNPSAVSSLRTEEIPPPRSRKPPESHGEPTIGDMRMQPVGRLTCNLRTLQCMQQRTSRKLAFYNAIIQVYEQRDLKDMLKSLYAVPPNTGQPSQLDWQSVCMLPCSHAATVLSQTNYTCQRVTLACERSLPCAQ